MPHISAAHIPQPPHPETEKGGGEMPPPAYLVNLRISARTANGKIRINSNHMI